MPVVDPDIQAYALAHTTAPTAELAALAEETQAMGRMAGMMTGPLEGRFLEFLVWLSRARVVLEIGTFTGFGANSMAAALEPGGKVITCDINPETQAVAKKYAGATGVAARIAFRLGPALDTIAGLDAELDLVFIDADKPNYANYYEAVLPKLSEHGLIAVDNTLWGGAVLDSGANDENTSAIKAFNDMVLSDARVVCVQLTVRDGVTLIRRRA